MLTFLQACIDKTFALVPRKVPSISKPIKIIAHRGVHDDTVVENTYAAFERAMVLNVWGVECDIRQTRDGHFIVHHDANLTRLWGNDGVISQMTLAEIQAISPQIPSLTEVIRRFGSKLHFLIELKAPFNDEACLEKTLSELSAKQDYHLLSLDESIFAKLEQFNKECLLLVPEVWNVQRFCQLSLSEGYGGVLGHYLLMTNKRNASLHQAGKIVGTGFINSKNSLYRELNRTVDWVFSDNVEELLPHIPPYR